MGKINIHSNGIGDEIERFCRNLSKREIQIVIDWTNNLLGLNMQPSAKTHEAYVDALYNKTIFYFENLLEEDKITEYNMLSDKFLNYLDNFEPSGEEDDENEKNEDNNFDDDLGF